MKKGMTQMEMLAYLALTLLLGVLAFFGWKTIKEGLLG